MGTVEVNCMLSGPVSVFTVTTDELRAQNIPKNLDECMKEDFVVTREKLRLVAWLFSWALGKKGYVGCCLSQLFS